MSKKLIHYSHPQSRGMRTSALLKHFDIPHEYVEIDFRSGANKTEEYLKIHPLGKVPALRHGDNVVIESGAITLYLADVCAEEMKAPAPGTPERGLLYQWLFFLQTTLEPVAMKGYGLEDKSETRAEIKPLLEGMQSRIRGPFILGEEFGMLDVVLFVELGWYRAMGFYPEGLDFYDDYLSRVAPLVKM